MRDRIRAGVGTIRIALRKEERHIMSFESHIMFPMSIEATQIFTSLHRNAEVWRKAIDLRDNIVDYIKHGPPKHVTYIKPRPPTQTTGRNVNIMA